MNKKWLKLVLFVLVMALMVVAAPGLSRPAAALSSDIVISQVYGGGGNAGATYTNDFVELFNRGTSAVSVNGWSLQYASSTGTSWTNKTDLPNATLQPGQYFLVQLSSGGANGVALPASDHTGSINMSGSAGKIALMSTTTVIANGTICPSSSVVDLVGFGPATNCSETAPTTPNLTATTAAIRGGSGCTETDNNSSDFANGTPTPRNSASPVNTCTVVTTPSLSITDVSLNEGDSGTTSFDFTVSLSIPAGTGGVTFDIATADNTATVANNDYAAQTLTGQTILAGSSTYLFSVLVNGDVTPEASESFFVNVTNVVGATIGDGQGEGTVVNDDIILSFVHDIQGNGSAITGAGPFAVEAIVVGDYQTQGSGQLRGFFIQEEDADADADPATSEGIFVFCTTCPVAVSVGDKVRVTGVANEFFNMSQLTASTVASVSVLSSNNTLPTAATLQLPVPGVPNGDLAAATSAINAYYEAVEGMLVTFPDTLSVSEYFELARYGQVILTEGGRPHTFTAVNTPSAAGFIDNEINLASRTIILDDTDNRQNRPVDTPNTTYYHPVPGLSITNFFRGGDTITNLTGVLHWSFAGQSGTDAWRIRPVTEAYSYAFTPVNPRPEVPTVDGSLTVASFNVLNYFLTIDTSNTCAPTQNQDCRGADSAQELERQRTKMLSALAAIDADVFGFMEMENTPGVEPLADIVAGLPGYDYIDTGVIGTDAIRVGIIYKTSTVTPVGNYAILDSSVDPNFDTSRNRPALAQTFEETATGEQFTVVVNHLKSKGSSCGAADDDTTTGQGNCNGTRTLAAQALADWLETYPTGSSDPDVLIIGDLNSYAKEDPIVALLNAGYTDLVAEFGGAGAYGYVFDGQLGYLDHALANASLNNQVAEVAEWHINADEIPLFDYNDDERTADEASFDEESDALPLYEPNAYRTSDHDPVLIGLNLSSPADDIFVSSTTPGSADGLDYGSEDILQWTGANWLIWFDGSDAGLEAVKSKHNINAFYIPDPNGEEVLIVFNQNRRTVPGITPKVEGMDIVKWDGALFSLYFDGSDVGLQAMAQEKIDGLHLLDPSLAPTELQAAAGGTCEAYMLISTHGVGRVTNYDGATLKISGEDVLGFCATSLGDNTAGKWIMLLDGSAEGMPRNSTDSIAATDDGQTLFLTTRSTFNVDSATGGHSMVYRYDVGSGEFSGPIFSAPVAGLTTKVDGLHMVADLNP